MMSANIEICTRPRNDIVYADLVSQEIDPFLADLLSRRVDANVSAEACFSPLLKNLQPPNIIPDMQVAVGGGIVGRIYSVLSGAGIAFKCCHKPSFNRGLRHYASCCRADT